MDPFYGWRTQDADGLLDLLVDDWFGDLQYMGLHGIIYIIIYTYYPIYIYTILYIYILSYIYIGDYCNYGNPD